MFRKYFFIVLIIFISIEAGKCDEYDDNIMFIVYNTNSSPFVWIYGTDLTTQGCDANGKFAFIVHGFKAANRMWQQELAQKLLKYRGGCVIIMNWAKYSNIWNYYKLIVVHFKRVSDVIVRRLQSLEAAGVSGDNMFMYGHSLGARLVIDAGIKFGPSKISQIDACELAGPGFSRDINSKEAAKNVQCIHTSASAGTFACHCHQDWLMGKCGLTQPGAFFNFKMAHSICNRYYISAFDNNFTANNRFSCSGVIPIELLPPNFKMGYNEDRRNSSIVGKIAAPTSKYFPFTGV